jgi:hypothetical protein
MSKKVDQGCPPISIRSAQRVGPRKSLTARRSQRNGVIPDTPVEIQIDASTVVVSADAGELKIAAAPGVDSLDVWIEQFADGSLLISDKFGSEGVHRIPDFHAVVHALKIVLGPTGNDKFRLDIPPGSRLAENIRVFDAHGDEIPEIPRLTTE